MAAGDVEALPLVEGRCYALFHANGQLAIEGRLLEIGGGYHPHDRRLTFVDAEGTPHRIYETDQRVREAPDSPAQAKAARRLPSQNLVDQAFEWSMDNARESRRYHPQPGGAPAPEPPASAPSPADGLAPGGMPKLRAEPEPESEPE